MYTEVFTVGTTFPATQCINISTAEDDFLEGDHNFTVSIVSTTLNNAVTISSPSAHVVTIDDNDGAYVFSCESYHTYVGIISPGAKINYCNVKCYRYEPVR